MTAYPTTIVIPLYGDLPTAERAIRSVLETVDLSVHRLLLVNDCGPEVEEIERVALALIEDRPGAHYERNPRNLGFVDSCNRAALELDDTDNDILLLNSDAELHPGALDEMSAVLHLSEKHGVVTARSNHATIATIPVRTHDGIEAPADRSVEVFRALAHELPRYTVVPVAHGFCFLARRALLRNYGLFDKAFAPGYGEENDFCLRVNAYGYSSVMANRAYAHHEGERSFRNLERQKIQDDHEALLVSRYPFYPAAVRHYLSSALNVVDRFADFIVPAPSRRAKVLIDLHHMSLIYDGSVRNALTFLGFLRDRRAQGGLDELEIVVGSSEEAARFFDLPRFGFRVVFNDNLDELFDLGFSLAPIAAEAQIQRLDRLCVRWVASHLDIIALRSLDLLEYDYGRRRVVRDSLRFADRVIAISQATLDDTLAYFPELQRSLPARTTVLHQGVATQALRGGDDAHAHHRGLSPAQEAAVVTGGYVLVVGNSFRHKQLDLALDALRGAPWTVIAFGSREARDPSTNIFPIAGGYLTDSDVSRLYDNAAAVVYPSAYEGFGLPIAEAALHGKPLALFETAVAREVVSGLEISEQVRYFDDFSNLQETVAALLSDVRVPEAPSVRSIEEYNDGILRIIRSTLDEPVSLERLRARDEHFSAVRDFSEAAQSQFRARLGRRSVRLTIAVSDRLQFLRPLARRVYRTVRPPRDPGVS
ncbi:glycosyltransferase [Microbacterium trichothecenolyticum]|uniref:glycosyltransferase n=1 Tax=Microbacterium trichothecenolyticum TaxID=69370 RepID=UPI001C6E908C|nr:glycosyltransferase [Microbacterium trichothecenolyticum]MBW9119448.1 glycosyltransferase [Microbacterium trichothecenolyticum]